MAKEIKRFEEMTRDDLQKLRDEIILNSCYFYDYNNSFGFYNHDICAFFDGYYDYLWELAEEKYNPDDVTHFLVINEFDNIDNLEYWFNCYDDLSWITFNNELRIGDKVKWNDPAIDDFNPEEIEIQRKRVYTIIEVINDEICLISDDFGDSEVYFDELEKIGE